MHARAHAHTRTHTHCLHVHLWRTFDICEGSIQRPSRPATLGESLASGKCQGVPSNSCMSHFSALPTVLSLTFQPHPTKKTSQTKKTSHKGSFCGIATFGYKATTLSLQEGTDGVDLFTPHALTWHPAGPLVNWKRNSGRTVRLWATSGASVSHTLTARHIQYTLPVSTHSRLTVHCVCVCVNHTVSRLSACLPIIQMESLPAPEPFPKALVTEDHREHICWDGRSRCGPVHTGGTS